MTRRVAKHSHGGALVSKALEKFVGREVEVIVAARGKLLIEFLTSLFGEQRAKELIKELEQKGRVIAFYDGVGNLVYAEIKWQ